MNIVITAGGTEEPIDGVRGITNFSGGRLGQLIALQLAVPGNQVFHIRGKRAPACHPLRGVIDIPVTDTASVFDAMMDIKREHDIDYFIHAMAISDYTVKAIIDLDDVIDCLDDAAKHGMVSLKYVEFLLRNPNEEKQGKVSSSIVNPIIYLKQTPKLINRVKELWPNTKLIGFKLLNGVPEEELIGVAQQSMIKSGADWTIANDLQNISIDKHKALLVGTTGVIDSAETKEDIAAMIGRLVK